MPYNLPATLIDELRLNLTRPRWAAFWRSKRWVAGADKATWGKEWGKVPHGSQPIST
jgi:hypothetical protein